jgi:hypothetical protein
MGLIFTLMLASAIMHNPRELPQCLHRIGGLVGSFCLKASSGETILSH